MFARGKTERSIPTSDGVKPFCVSRREWKAPIAEVLVMKPNYPVLASIVETSTDLEELHDVSSSGVRLNVSVDEIATSTVSAERVLIISPHPKGWSTDSGLYTGVCHVSIKFSESKYT